MNWIIRDGQIINPEGDGIRIEDPRGNILIANMKISGAKGSGIVLGGRQPAPNSIPLGQLLDLVESHLHELPNHQHAQASEALKQARTNPETSVVRASLKIIYDLAVNVAGSTLATVLTRFFV
jgi:hypothetical protein